MANTTVPRNSLFELSLSTREIDAFERLPAAQQPDWAANGSIAWVRAQLAARPGLVTWEEVQGLCRLLGEVAAGRSQVLQAGDCAEDPAESTADHVTRKLELLARLAGIMTVTAGVPVVPVGRIAGQFAKPRSRSIERVGHLELPSFRGHLVNAPDRDLAARRPDPRRMLSGYDAAARAMATVRRWNSEAPAPTWTSHEALLLDYELPMVRRNASGARMLTSTHWPWLGYRTGQLGGAHVELAAGIGNPIACKVGPDMTVDRLVALCRRLDPGRIPGRLTFIVRMGAATVAEKLPSLVAAVRSAGHPAIWLSDPMHANTVTGPSGRKVRWLGAIIQEVERCHAAVRSGRGFLGGLHLEVTPQRVLECVRDHAELAGHGGNYTTLCDPRLNPDQAVEVVARWPGPAR